MINQVELARQQHNAALADKIKNVRKELTTHVQMNLFRMCVGKSIGSIDGKLQKLEQKLLKGD